MSATEDNKSQRRSIGARRNPASQEAILQAAGEILATEGPAGFSIEAVARRARAGKPTIYRWWPNRTALLLELYQQFKNTKPFPDTGSLRGDLIAFLSNQLVGFWKDDHYGTVFRSIVAEAQTDPAAAEALSSYERDRRTHSQIIIERAKARGEIADAVDAALAIDMVVAFAWHRLLTGRIAETPADIDPFVDIVLDGLSGHQPTS